LHCRSCICELLEVCNQSIEHAGQRYGTLICDLNAVAFLIPSVDQLFRSIMSLCYLLPISPFGGPDRIALAMTSWR
jgi:hypothetical protein